MPKDQWPNGADFEENIRQNWNKQYGDRRQEIAFIGLKGQIDESSIRKKLDGCLIKNYLTAPDLWLKAEDPFPQWFKKAA